MQHCTHDCPSTDSMFVIQEHSTAPLACVFTDQGASFASLRLCEW